MVRRKVGVARVKLLRICWLIGCLVLLLAVPTIMRAATGTLLAQATVYPRLVRLTYGSATSNGWIIASTTGKLFVSKDDGKTFAFLGDAPVQPGSRIRCCETLYELPRTVGNLQAGTLLYSATYSSGVTDTPQARAPGAQPRAPREQGNPAIEVYVSTDQGAHWTYHSTPVQSRGEKGTGGLWEPQFSVSRDGALVMFWSDETYICCSQKLSKIRTTDGVTWKDSSDVVASVVQGDRPGMIIVNELPSNIYFMSYEICGDPVTGPKCAAYYRISRDGWNYGPASNMGKRIETEDGQYFEHAPANIWSPSPLSPNGAILVVGQVLHNKDGSIASQNGKVIFVNPLLDGSGPWLPIKAPVEVPNSYDNPCPNYSSALMPVQNGSALLEFASDFYEMRKCGTFFATKPWTEIMPPKAKTAP